MGASKVLNILNLDSWSLVNIATGESIEGQFHAEELTENISQKYATHTSLSRQNPNVQFVSGEPNTISFNAKLFDNGIGDNVQVNTRGSIGQGLKVVTLKERLQILKRFAKVDPDLRRPPVLTFHVGDGSEISFAKCVITSLGGISYARPKGTGGMREATLSINILEYHEYKIEDGTEAETRYHNVTEGEYYEMLTFREYQEPGIGDVIRKRHPKQPNIQVGDTVKLPAFRAIQTEQVQQTSVALKNGWGKRDTPQKRLRQAILDSRNRVYISHVILED